MAWFGEQFSSLTEKLTDFTKEVLIDHGNNETSEESPQQRYEFSPKELLELCREKDAQIEILMNEKESLEKSIDELDLQHSEAITELLHLKNKALQENTALKHELASLTEKKLNDSVNASKSLLQNFEHSLDCDYIKTKFNNLTSSSSDYNIAIKNINLVNILGVIWKSISENSVDNFIKWLEDQKYLLETQTSNADDCSVQKEINRISNYIIFLHQISETPEIFSPVLDEIAAVIYFLLSNNIKLSDRLSIPDNVEEQNLDSSIEINQETADFNSQTEIYDFKHAKIYLSTMPEPFLCDNSSRNSGSNSSEGCASHHVQTDEDDDVVQNCEALLYELRQYARILMQEKADLQEEVVRLQSLQQQQQQQPTLDDVSTQTNESAFSSVTSSSQELEVYINILEQEKSDLTEKIIKLESLSSKCTSSVNIQTDDFLSDITQTDERMYNSGTSHKQDIEMYINMLDQENADHEKSNFELDSLSNKVTSSVSIQTDDDIMSSNDIIDNQHQSEFINCDSTLQEYQTCINNLQQEKSELQDKIIELQNKVDKSMLTVTSQTDEPPFNSNINELNAYVCILEQEKADLNEQISHMKFLLSKTTSSISIQTDENMPFSESLQAEISALNEILKAKEKDFEDIHQKLKGDLNNLEKELDYKESVNIKNENTIKSLRLDLENSKTCSESLQAEITALNETLNFKRKDFDDNLHKLKEDLHNLEEELDYKKSLIIEKENLIKSLKFDLENSKTSIEDLTENSNLNRIITSVQIQTDENYTTFEMYKSEITKLQESVNAKNKELQLIQEKMLADLNSLQNEVSFKNSVINDKVLALNSLNFDIENYKQEIESLNSEINVLKSSNNEKMYESELSELKTYINEKEKESIAAQNEFTSCLSDFKESLQNKDILLLDKENTIHSLKLEVDELKGKLKHSLASDLNVFNMKQQDYAKDIDTSEEYDNSRVFVETCNRCKSVVNGESNENDFRNEVRLLQEKLKALDIDKNQLLCVLNEKTQECSTLKAEVHKLTNIVASEKQALFKLQQDNCMLRESRDNTDPELTKEAIQKLSRIIRDKDLEIESLKQKNNTLTTLIQDASLVPDHMQSLIEEKENLSKQINVFKADRDKIMVRYNTIDKDCRQYAAEVKKLKSALSDQKEKFDILEQKHFSVAQQYEEKQKSLINTQNEMIAMKQRVSDLEQQQVDIKEKYSELLNKFNSDTMIQITKDEFEEKNSQIQQLININSEKDHLIQEKDCLIHDLTQQIKSLKLECEQQQTNLSNLQIKIEELTTKLKEHEVLVEQLKNEKESLDVRFQDKNSELALLKEMNERLNMNVKEKEFTIQSMTEKISSLSHYISSDHITSDTVDINQILADSESMFSKAQTLYKERDETLLALNQSKQENQSLRNDIQRMKSNEIHLKKELERLRLHLLEIEENYTAEALKAEEREKELRNELVEVKHRAEISNTAVVDTNQRASIQIASLQEQLSMIANQRDLALSQVSVLEDKVQQHSATVSKLQLVLEQMQRGHERKIKEAEKKSTALLENQRQLYKELEEKLQAKEVQLEESSQALEAATRLSEQLDAKEEVIANLKSELSKTESKIKSTAQEIDTIKSNTEGKVDRVVMKSLVLGYFSTPPGQKSEVIRLLARVLDFNQEEMEKAGIVVGRNVQKKEQGGLFSSIFSRLPSLSSERNPPSSEKSFTTLFVQFLENESQPIIPMPFPVDKMTQDVSFKSQSSKKSPTSQRKSLSRNSPLLLDIDSAFPTFTPVPAVEYSQSPAPSILREVLE